MDATGAVTAGATARINANGSAEFASGDVTISSAGAATFKGNLDSYGVVSKGTSEGTNIWTGYHIDGRGSERKN